jgi:hypothetical protein
MSVWPAIHATLDFWTDKYFLRFIDIIPPSLEFCLSTVSAGFMYEAAQVCLVLDEQGKGRGF